VKKYQEAIADLDKAIGIDDSYTKAYLKRADCYYSLGGVDKINLCIKDYEKAAELSSEEEAR
jgi:Tfp pilus assembly protein PilF